MATWTEADMPDATGRTVIITGASSGLGAAAADAFATRGADVVLAVRDEARGERVRDAISTRRPQAKLRVARLDLADLASIRAFAAGVVDTPGRVDVLMNNAGLGMQPRRALTADGFERQFGTNHLGHFALTGLLMPALLRAPEPRVVTISSIAHRRGRIEFDDLQGARRYRGGRAYGQSKLANLLFAFELDRRARAAGTALVSVAAHPGIAQTGFFAAIGMPPMIGSIAGMVVRAVGQDARSGALPGLYAASMPDIRGGQYWGASGPFELRGPPGPAVISHRACDLVAAARLWAISQDLTGVTYRFAVA